MANRKVVDLPELTTLSNDDELYIVDISDLTESSEGTSKKIKASNFVPAGGELIANKQNSLTVDGTGVKYSTVDAVRSEALLLEGTQVGNPITGDIEFIGDGEITSLIAKQSETNIIDLTFDTDENSINLKSTSALSEGQVRVINGSVSLTQLDKTSNKFNSIRAGEFGIEINSTKDNPRGLISNQDFSPNITDLDYTQKIYVDSGLASKADKQGTILYHSLKWFTPSSTVSNVGATVTSIGTQFTSAMVGSILRINGEDRLIISYTSSTVVVVDVAYSTNYSAVVAGSWGVYSKSIEVRSDNTIRFYAIESGILRTAYLDQYMGFYNEAVTILNMAQFNSLGGLFAGNKPIRWNNATNNLTGTVDIGIRRNAAGVLEIYNGVTADGTLTNRRDLMVRKLFVNKSTDNGIDRLQVDGTISMSPATLSTQGVVKSQLDAKADLASPSFTGSVSLSTTPTTSAGTYDILTRNISTGVVEKRASNILNGVLLLDKTTTTYNATSIGSSQTIKTWVIPANSIPADCILKLTIKTSRLLGSGNPFMSLSLSGSTGWLNGQNGQTARRNIIINDTTYDYQHTSGLYIDDIISPDNYSTFTIDRTIDNTLDLKMNCDVTGDIFKFYYIMIEIVKQ